MGSALKTQAGEQVLKPDGLTFSKAVEILWDCAWEGLLLAFFVQIVGSILFGVLGDLFQEMLPSPPPISAEAPAPLRPTPAHFQFFQQHSFILIFAIIFIGGAVAQLAKQSRNQQAQDVITWGQRIFGTLPEKWFRLIVVNAFVAFGTVFVLQFSQWFSMTHWLWQLVNEMFQQLMQGMGSVLGNRSHVGWLESWITWYKANQVKFLFWLLYSAAICDDLGLPNYKALCRFLWRRFTRFLHLSKPAR